MEIIYLNFLSNNFIDHLAITIGEFDGVHKAHLTLIEKVKEIGKEKKLKTGLITFEPHPDFILNKQSEKAYLTPLKEKISIIKKMGLDYFFIIPFDNLIANLEPKMFINNFLIAIGVEEVVAGFDFHYGKCGIGTAQTIKNDSDKRINVSIVEEIMYNDKKISSTLIRKYLAEGEIKDANILLGRPYQLSTKVVKGMQIGTKIGVPTANLILNDNYVKIKPGVYVVTVNVNNIDYLGICNIGHNPSFNYQDKLTIEVHLIDFSGDLYNKEIKISFIDYIRDEEKFPSIEVFQKQILKDIEIAKNTIK